MMLPLMLAIAGAPELKESVGCGTGMYVYNPGGGSKVIFMKALAAPSPPPLPPTPPTMPPPEEDLWDEYCPDDMEKDECKQKAAIAGGAATVCVLAIVVVGASKKGGSVPQL